MKKLLFSVLLSSLIFTGHAQPSLLGAWEGETIDETGEQLKAVVIFSEGYQSLAIYKSTGELIGTQGGTWNLKENVLTEKTEFDTFDSSQVGQEIKTTVQLTDTSLHFPENGMTLKRIDSGTPGELAGAWIFYSRNIKGSEFSREADHPRKTMKILSGTRFQWIAYDTKTKEVMGSGGGTYETKDGKYIERIEFFAKDPTRAGMELEFNFDLTQNSWRHTGLSSKGDPIDETWNRRK